MKKHNVFLLAILVIIASIIFTSCQIQVANTNPDYCPYCKSSSLTYLGNKHFWENNTSYSETLVKCNYCGKTFGVHILFQ